ncbi:MAG: efflux transporter outer membrane subunit [Thermoanaerobaculia bacterium]|nr:efflux transporter outer membrane subunit [Thermoanaerobaculia bacterium]
MLLANDKPGYRSIRAWAAAAVGLALALSSCTVGPDYVPPSHEVPSDWKHETANPFELEAPPFETWWVALEDPVLTDLVERAIEANLDLRRAVARIAESRARLGVASGQYYPDGTLEASYTRQELSNNGAFGAFAPEGGFDDSGQYDLGVGFNWEIDVFGRVRRGVEAATAELQASVEDYRDVMVILVADVASNYVQVRTLQDRIRFAEANVEAQSETLRLTTARFNAGLTSRRDVSQAESNLASTEAAIPTLYILLEQARNRIAVLLGEPPGAVDDLLTDAASIPAGDPWVATGPPAELLRRRPDIRRAERELAAQTARIGVATAELYPIFSLGGYLGLQAASGGDLFESDSATWSILPGVRLNIFNRSRLRSQIRVEQALAQQALLGYEQSLLLALEEVEGALIARELEKRRRESLRYAVEATERTVQLVHTQYISGLTDFQSYLDAQRSLLSQQDALAVSEGQVVQNLIALNRAVGGGWELPEPDATTREQAGEIEARYPPGEGDYASGGEAVAVPVDAAAGTPAQAPPAGDDS